jgi:GNAT superfamily N-acetyltransferase
MHSAGILEAMTDVASLERATLAAVPPEAQEEIGPWLAGFDRGTVGRAHSAAPLQHAPGCEADVPRVEAGYRARDLPPVFRVADVPALAGLRRVLAQRGYAPDKPTLVQAGPSAGLAALAHTHVVALTHEPGEDWSQVFLGEGFDPVDGASRLAILARARDSVFGGIAIDGRIAAVGSACFSEGWCGVHGMRTLPAFRGLGLASCILAAFGREALARGIARAYLQVEESNKPAQSVYRRAGLATAWAYEYWR